MNKYEYRSELVTAYYDEKDTVEQACNAWAQEGFEVFSIVCPDPRNYKTYRITARRLIELGVQEKWQL